MKFNVLLVLIVFTAFLSTANAMQMLEQPSSSHFARACVQTGNIYNQGTASTTESQETLRVDLPELLLKDFTIGSTKISVPQHFELIQEEQNALKEVSIYGAERIKRVVSYLLENRIHQVCAQNSQLAALYLMTSIWSGNDNIELLSGLYERDESLISDIENSDKSIKNIQGLIHRVQGFWPSSY